MNKILSPKEKPQTHTDKVHRVNRRVIVFFIVATIMVTLACYENPLFGITTMDKYLTETPEAVVIIYESEHGTKTEVIEAAPPKQAVPQPKPTNPPAALPESVPNTAGANEYAVSAQDFSCICQVSGNVTQTLNIKDNQLEIVNPDGSAEVFEKIGENTYKKSWMGYYILVEDGQETQVDEEKSVVIILTDTGYVMEHYKGSEGSPCCIYTFSQTE